MQFARHYAYAVVISLTELSDRYGDFFTVSGDGGDTVWAVIVLHLGLTVPFVAWLMYTFFKGVPIELEECAAIDGAGFIRRFVSIVLPLSMPGIASASIFTAFLSLMVVLQNKPKRSVKTL